MATSLERADSIDALLEAYPDAADDLSRAFLDASESVAALVASGKKVPQATLLRLYGFFKQATEGDCEGPRPGFFDPRRRAKYDAWKRLVGTSGEEAKRGYLRTAGEALGYEVEGIGEAGAIKIVSPEATGGAVVRGAGAGAGADAVGGVGAASGSERPAEASSASSASAPGGGGGAPDLASTTAPVSSHAAALESDTAYDSSHPLHAAAASDCAPAVSSLLGRLAGSPGAVDSRDGQGCTALHVAADAGALSAMSTLLSCGADPNAADEDGLTPLHYAALARKREAVDALLKAGADPDAKTEEGESYKDLMGEA